MFGRAIAFLLVLKEKPSKMFEFLVETVHAQPLAPPPCIKPCTAQAGGPAPPRAVKGTGEQRKKLPDPWVELLVAKRHPGTGHAPVRW